MKIEMIVFDVDGCLTPGEGGEWDLDVIGKVRDCNRRSRADDSIPGITLLTGRQQPYVEAMAQAIGAWRPAMFESGLGMFMPVEFKFKTHPDLSEDDIEALLDFEKALRTRLRQAGAGFLQPGKNLSFTIYPSEKLSMDELGLFLGDIIRESAIELLLDRGVICYNLLPRGLDKGHGLRWLSRETGIQTQAMAGMGDTGSDLSFLELVGLSACPSNAIDKVKQAVDFVSDREHGRAGLELIEKCIELNRRQG